ncbi:hypothetical protein F4779DRAFT_578777 [Xylariaceae sp. FL0662B]|nr:hypothetical protein F4779DRAFT_578777 [Xylariaceae sp. FL0662B]
MDTLHIWLLDTQSRKVKTIVKDLSKRDSRFLFIKESFDEFLVGKFGLNEANELLRTDTSSLLGSNEIPADLTQRRYRCHDGAKFYIYLVTMFHDIVNTAIYELLNVFDIDITLEQALEVDHGPGGNIGLLKALYEKSKGLLPQPAKTISFSHPPRNLPEGHAYRYPNRLQSPNIRVLSIQPGLKDRPIECQLQERSLDCDCIEEALSYAWGEPVFDKVIKIDGSSFCITRNLNDILRSLRRPDVTRTIWIDAICINQFDMEEKGH